MKLEMNFRQIKAEREAGKDFGRDMVIEYPVDLFIQDINHDGNGRAVVSFRLQTKTNPDIANFTVAGDLLLMGREEEVETWTTPLGRGPPMVWKHIYQESMNILAVLAKVIEVPFPTPKTGEIVVGH